MTDAQHADQLESLGWKAIDDALARIYGNVEPHHYGTVLKYALGGPDPIDGVSVYEATTVRPHWHYVTYGFSELYEKESPNPDASGFGFELTFRLARDPGAETPPIWPINFLQNLARYVFESGNGFAAGHSMNANGPIASDEDTRLTAMAFREDPELPTIDTPHGKVAFLQVVGVTQDELAAIQAWNCAMFLDELARTDPLLVADLSRASSLDQPALARRVDEGIERDGSSLGGLFVDTLEATVKRGLFRKRLELTIGAFTVETVRNVFRGRLLHGRPAELVSEKTLLTLQPGDKDAFEPTGRGAALTLTEKTSRAIIATLRPKRGTYAVPEMPSLVITVVPTVMREARTGKVLESIG